MNSARPYKTIAVFLSNFFDPYQDAVARGIKYQTQLEKVKVIFVNGGALGHPTPESLFKNKLYSLIRSTNVDGLILTSGAIANYIEEKELRDFISSYSGLPMVSLGIELKGIPSIVVDNKAGTYQLTQHLIHVHQCKEFVFIKGPEHNAEAHARFEGFRQALEEAGIPLDPSRVFPGDFQRESGMQALRELWEKKIPFDAVVAADDLTAIGAYDAIKKYFYQDLDRIRVCGFDDIDLCTSISPSLTTIGQPLFEQGELAVKLLMQSMDRKELAPVYQLPTKQIYRQSCGCKVENQYQSIMEQEIGKNQKKLTLEDLHQSIAQKFNINLSDSFRSSILDRCLLYVIKLILQALQEKKAQIIKEKLGGILKGTLNRGIRPTLWVNLLSEVINRYYQSNPQEEWKDFIPLIWHVFLSVLYQEEVKAISEKALYDEFMNGILQRVGHELINVYDKEHIRSSISHFFHNHQIHCQLSLLESSGKEHELRIFLDLFDSEKESEILSLENFMVESMGKTQGKVFLLTPLHREYQWTGLAFFELDEVEGGYFELLSHRISSALNHVDFMDKVKKHNQQLVESLAEKEQELVRLRQQLKQ